MRIVLGPVLGLMDSVGRLDVLITSTAPFAKFCWDFYGGAIDDCIGV